MSESSAVAGTHFATAGSVRRRTFLLAVLASTTSLGLVACGGAASTTATLAPPISSVASASAASGVETHVATASSLASTLVPAASTSTAVAVAASSSSKPVSGTAKKITFWHWGDQTYYERYRTLADAFQVSDPRVSVDVVLVGGSYTDKLLVSMSSGTPPDSFVHDAQWVQRFGRLGGVASLDDRVATSTLLKMPEYSKLAISGLSYHGKLMALPGVGIPSGSAPGLIFYNADHFRQAGLATPYEQWRAGKWTWGDFIEATQKLVKRDAAGKMTIVPVDDQSLARLWINTAGGKEVDNVVTPTKSYYGQPEAIKALQFLYDLRYKYRVLPIAGVQKELGANPDDAFAQGRLSLRFRWTTGINFYRPITTFKWGMVPYPKDLTYANDATSDGLANATGIAQADAAWSWIEWASSPVGQTIDAKTTTGVPFNAEARQVFTNSLQAISGLETPDVPGMLIPNGQYSFLRLFCVDEARLNSDIINPQLNKLWANQASASTVGQSIAQLMDAFLKANPQT